MSLKIRFRFDGKCNLHPRYNPETDGRPQNTSCQACDVLYVIWLYTRIAMKKAEQEQGVVVRRPASDTTKGALEGQKEEPEHAQADSLKTT